MLLRLSRLSLGLAAAAAAAGLFAPTGLRGLCADVAPAFAVAAFVLWRAASATRRRLADRHDAIPEAVPLGPDSFAQAAQSVADAVRAAPTLEQALLRTGEVLRGELGARSVRVFRVSHDGAAPGMSELIAADPAFLAPWRAVLLDQSAIGRALRELRPCIDLPHMIAMPVVRHGHAVALLQLVGIHLSIEAATLRELIASTAEALAQGGEWQGERTSEGSEALQTQIRAHRHADAARSPVRSLGLGTGAHA